MGNTSYVCRGKETLARFLPYMKYLWKDQMACISLLSVHKFAGVFEDYKCVSKYKKRMKLGEGKRMNEWNVKIFIADEDGQCMMVA